MAHINVLLSSFPGSGLPSTLNIPLRADTPVSTFAAVLQERLPQHVNNLSLRSYRLQPISITCDAPLSSLAEDGNDFLPLILTASLAGGKGGFGSQLRAAGGRMSSRKNRNGVQRDPNASSRNLDGRRLRTVTEAKALAEYLATKPDMDRKEREEKRQRWESIVEAAERREEEIKNGRKNVRLDGEWVEKKEEEEGKTREAILGMFKQGLEGEGRTGIESEEEYDGETDDMEVEAEASGSGSSEGAGEAAGGRSFFGWEEEELSDDDDGEEEVKVAQTSPPDVPKYEGKGKARA